MMGYTNMGFGSGFGMGFGLLHLFCLIFVLGIVLFIIWAVRVLDKKQLHKWVVSFLVVGILGMVLSSFFMFKMGNWDRDGKDGQQWGFYRHCGVLNNEEDAAEVSEEDEDGVEEVVDVEEEA